MAPTTLTALGLGLLATASATSTSLHYKLRARVTGPQNAATPQINGWPLEVARLGYTTRLPPDYMDGVAINSTFDASRGGDIFYTQMTSSNTTSRVRTDAPNAADEVTPFGFDILAGTDDFPLSGFQMSAVRYAADGEMSIVLDSQGVPVLQRGGGPAGTFVACDGLYREWDTLAWIDVEKYGTDPIYNGPDYQNCTEIQLVAECASGGPSVEGLRETACVEDFEALA